MKFVFKLGFLLIMLLLCEGFSRTAGAFELKLDPTGIDGGALDAVNAFLKETITSIPASMTTAMPGKIVVRFKDFGNHQMGVPACPAQVAPGTETDLASDSVKTVSEQFGEFRGPLFFGQPEIEINRASISEILKGPENSRKYDCGHHTLYRLIQATLIHELAHAYDHVQKVSQRKDFLHLMKFYKKKSAVNLLLTDGLLPEGMKARNELRSRSPDVHEFKNPRESFAVNLEFFLLDPEFSCRRPAVNAYFSKMLNFQPKSNCALNTTVILNSNFFGSDGRIAQIDPERVYQIHYFNAGPGPEMMSRWGHAMYRLVICDPTRKQVGPDCMKDTDSHVIISYRANVKDYVVSQFKGLAGGYASRMFLFPLNQIIPEYNRDQFRDIYSSPIKMTNDEKRNFVYQTLEQYWSYEGKYRFVSNNCATESLALARGSLTGEAIDHAKGWNPAALSRTFNRIERTDISVFDNKEEALNEGLFSPASKTDLQSAYDSVVLNSEMGQGLITFLHESKSLERKNLYQKQLIATQDRSKLAANFLVLENAIYWSTQERLGKSISKKEDADSRKKSLVPTELEKQIKLDVERSARSPWERLKSGYGVPLEADFAEAKPIETLFSDKYQKSYAEWTVSNFPELKSEIVQIESNLAFFDTEMSRKK